MREIAAVHPLHGVHLVGPDVPPGGGFGGWVVVHYDLLAKHPDALPKLSWTGIILDEAQYLKNHTSQRGGARAHGDAAYDSPVGSLPAPAGGETYRLDKAFCPSPSASATRTTTAPAGNGRPASNLEQMRVQLHGVMLRRTTDEVLDLPP
jgi:hypothetical protein